MTESCKNVSSVLPKNLRKATFSKVGDSDAEKKSCPIKSSLSKVLDDNVALFGSSHRPSSSTARIMATAGKNDGMITSRSQQQQMATNFSQSPHQSTTRRRQEGIGRVAVKNDIRCRDHDNGAFWLEHNWRAVEKQQMKKRNGHDLMMLSDDDDDENANVNKNNNPVLKVCLERTLPASDDSGRFVKFDRTKNMLPATVASKNASVELNKKHNRMLQELEEEARLNPQAAATSDRNRGFFGAPKSQVLHIVHDEIRNLNSIGSSKRRGPPPSQLASSTTLRQYREKTSRRTSETSLMGVRGGAVGTGEQKNQYQREQQDQRLQHLATLTLEDLGQGGTSTPRNREEKRLKERYDNSVNNSRSVYLSTMMPSNQIIVDHSKPGPARRYIRSGAYLIADRRRKQWNEADAYFIESSPAREIPKHKLVAEKGFGLLRKDKSGDGVGRSLAVPYQRSEISDLTEESSARKI